jgi:hypothetical protein
MFKTHSFLFNADQLVLHDHVYTHHLVKDIPKYFSNEHQFSYWLKDRNNKRSLSSDLPLKSEAFPENWQTLIRITGYTIQRLFNNCLSFAGRLTIYSCPYNSSYCIFRSKSRNKGFLFFWICVRIYVAQTLEKSIATFQFGGKLRCPPGTERHILRTSNSSLANWLASSHERIRKVTGAIRKKQRWGNVV